MVLMGAGNIVPLASHLILLEFCLFDGGGEAMILRGLVRLSPRPRS